ncbi:MAG: hypothetical protein IJO71_09495 [Microbacterium sp.]|uniref:hypothetical protein n=1 Tax=Microbacterium sp. TaxID=51671 RepID=UPI0025F2979E|nr:hypothetical protein [Microbacterium sp.]MBQ9917415.1 hypothetical protein [Microbacterium sp.]
MSAEDDLEVPVDTRPSRITPRPRTPRASDAPDGVDPDDLATFDGKLQRFRSDFPDAVIDTEVDVRLGLLGTPSYLITARVWREQKDAGKRQPDATAHSVRTHGDGPEPYASRALETAESVAIGRALRFLGYGTETSDEQRWPSQP